MTHRTLASGTYLEKRRHWHGSQGEHPFLVTTDAPYGIRVFQISPGLWDGTVPTLNGVSLDDPDPPVGILGMSGYFFIYLRLAYTFLTVESNEFGYSGFVHGAFLSSAEVITQGHSDPDPCGARAEGEFFMPIAVFRNGLKVAQVLTRHMQGHISGRIAPLGYAALTPRGVL